MKVTWQRHGGIATRHRRKKKRSIGLTKAKTFKTSFNPSFQGHQQRLSKVCASLPTYIDTCIKYMQTKDMKHKIYMHKSQTMTIIHAETMQAEKTQTAIGSTSRTARTKAKHSRLTARHVRKTRHLGREDQTRDKESSHHTRPAQPTPYPKEQKKENQAEGNFPTQPAYYQCRFHEPHLPSNPQILSPRITPYRTATIRRISISIRGQASTLQGTRKKRSWLFW